MMYLCPMETEKLPVEFISGGECSGFKFTLVDQTDAGYIYSVDSDGHIYYEVFRRKQVPICIDFERRIYSETQFKETYPKSNAFGVWAWTFPNLERAIQRLNEITNTVTL